MNAHAHEIDEKQALKDLIELLGAGGLSRQEGEVARRIAVMLRAAGVASSSIGHDDAHRRLDGYEVGNLIVRLPGTTGGKGRLFSTHMDKVPMCAGARPVKRDGRIVPAAKTALGGDNRTGCGALVAMARTILKRKMDHPPLTLLFTVGEEIGLQGARTVKKKDLGDVEMGFNVDGGLPAGFTIGAIGSHSWRVEVEGIAAHAGVHPDEGVSAAAITALAISDIHRTGWFGRVLKGKARGTSNVGVIEGGQATNEVTPHMMIRGESRSHSPAFLERITAAYVKAFERAAAAVRNAGGAEGRIRFEITDRLPGFRISKTSPVARHAERAARAVGLEPSMQITDGGLDANFLNRQVPTITFGAGQHRPHSVDEYVDLREYFDGCRLAVALATI